MRPRRAGFTLVELLVVIGIIAVLIGMLMPALTGARRSANAVKCAAQLRDLGNAIQIYANENQYAVPTQQSTYPAPIKERMWYDQLAKYVFKSGIASGSPATVINDENFKKTTFTGCPAFEYTYFKTNPIKTATGYGLNVIPLAPATVQAGSGDTKFIFNQFPATSSTPARYFKISEFKNPANRALMADANGYGGIQGRGTDLGPDPISFYTPQPGNNTPGDVDYYRHARKFDVSKPSCNVLFADLHVELSTPWTAAWSIRDPAIKATRAN